VSRARASGLDTTRTGVAAAASRAATASTAPGPAEDLLVRFPHARATTAVPTYNKETLTVMTGEGPPVSLEARFGVSNLDDGVEVGIGGVSVERCFVFIGTAHA
jgi:hypothetical protein